MRFSYKNDYINNKDKINSNLRSIDKHTLAIKGLINALSLNVKLLQTQVISDLKAIIHANPQKGPYAFNKPNLSKIYELPKVLINTPTIEYKKDFDSIVFSFPVVSFAPSINRSRTSIISCNNVENSAKNLSLFQLNVFYNLKEDKYQIALHQNMFDKGNRQPVFLGRIEVGDTHNTKHEKVRSTFHTHFPHDKNLDLNYNKSIVKAIYHCAPDVYVGHTKTSLETALKIAMKKFNITNDFNDAVNLKKQSVNSFLNSACGKEWTASLIKKPKSSLHRHQIEDILTEETYHGKPKLEIASFINSHI